MIDSRNPDIINISKVSSISVDESSSSGKQKTIRFYYDAPAPSEKPVVPQKFMLVSFIIDQDPPRIECELIYSKQDKKWIAEFEVDVSVKIRDRFIVTSGVDMNDSLEDRQKATVLDQGYIAITNGEPHPWIYENPSTLKGTLKQFLYKADGSLTEPIAENDLNADDRLITVYLPPDYNPERVPPYNLQITLDGMQYLDVMHMNNTFDNLIAAEKIKPTVIVFISPYCGPRNPEKKGFGSVCPPGYSLEMRLKEYSCNPAFADRLASLPDELQKKFPAITTDAEHTTIWGFSAGALQAAYTALLRPDRFGNVVAQSMMVFNIPTQNSEQWMEGNNGENWRKGITDQKNSLGDDTTWETSTAPLLPEEQHNEYLTQVVSNRFDVISKREINPAKPLIFCFTAGIDEEKYEPEKGTANLVVATDKFAASLVKKGHAVVAHSHHQKKDEERFVLVVSPGGHTPITCMESTPDVLTSMNYLTLSAAQKLIVSLNEHTKQSFWKNPPDKPTFEEVLDQYAIYSTNLDTNEREALNTAFWLQIKKLGTPIIEDLANDEVKVHFLFPRDEYNHNENKLYVCGDFHGFTSTNDERQEMHHKVGTDIMYRIDTMPKNSVVIYHFFQAPPKYQNKNRPDILGPGEAKPKSFYDIEPKLTQDVDPEIKKLILKDNYAKHWDYEGNIFCANVFNNLSHVQLMKDTNWEKLLNINFQHNGYLKNLSHRNTYLCDKKDGLHEAENVTKPPDFYFDKENTRSVTVFAPRNVKIDYLIIFHDGNGYMLTGAIECIDTLIGKAEVPKNTAVICINTLLGLIEKYKEQSPKEFAEAANPRAIEYGTKIDDYVTFIGNALKQLGYDNVPAKNITLIGGSMSGTASLFIGLKYKEKFGNVIAQAPSYSNRIILFDLVKQRKQDKELGKSDDLTTNIKLSCGKFDSLEFAQNLNLANTQELAEILGSQNKPLPIHTGNYNYGHTSCCWAQELTEMLPILYHQQRELNPQTSRLAEKQDLVEIQVDSNSTFQSKSSTAIFMKKGVASKKHKATDDFDLQPHKAKKEDKEFSQPIEKKRATSKDDSGITYNKRPGKL